MFSKWHGVVKNIWGVVGGLAVILTLSGCDSKVGEEPPPPTSQEFAGTRCLSETKPVIEGFLQGTAKKEELQASWNCVIGAVEKFQRYVRGRSADRYTPQELATFLEKNFLDNSKGETVSPALQAEFMKLKMVFIGGRADYLTRQEIGGLIRFFGELRDMTVGLNPYMKILSFNWSALEKSARQSNVTYFEEANKEVQKAARQLASLIEKNGQGYRLSDFVVFTQELGKFFGEEWQFPKVMTKYMPIVQKVKKALAGGDENIVLPREWSRLSLLASRGYIQYLRYYYFIKAVPETGTGYRLSYLARTIEDMLSVFQDLVAQKPEGLVSRQEVTDLFVTFQTVWPELKVSDGLVYETMKIKRLFFGGSTESFTTEDFERARLKVGHLKLLVEKFLPYYSIYGGEWEPDYYDYDEAQDIFLESQEVFHSAVGEVGKLFEGSYDLNDLLLLAREVETLYPVAAENLTAVVQKYLPLVVDVKNMILGGEDSSLHREGWSAMLKFVARLYADGLYYNYFINGQEMNQPQTLRSLSVFANQSLDIAHDLIAQKPSQKFTVAELSRIGQHLVTMDILPKGFSQEVLKQLLEVLVNNIMVDPAKRLAGHVPHALSFESVEVVRSELQVWLDVQKMVVGWKKQNGGRGWSVTALREMLQKEKTGASDFLVQGIEEMTLSLLAAVPMTVDKEGLLEISTDLKRVYNLQSLSQLNISRALSRLLLRSFTGDLQRLRNYQGVTLAEAEAAFAKLKPVVVELGLIQPSNISFISSRFREANIFMPHADGNTLASYSELADLVTMINSGMHLDTLLRPSLLKSCFKEGERVTNESRVKLSCVRSAYKEAMPKVMGATPEYVDYLKKSSKDEWAYYMNNIFKAAGYLPRDDGRALVEHIALVPHVIQYIEMMYARFDSNRDGYISTSEAVKAFPAFKGILMELAQEQLQDGSLKEGDLLDLFTYILRYGKPPETLWEKAHFALRWRGKPSNWDVWANRGHLSQILGYIADQIALQGAW
ncbi:MAG: hypothetical protein AAGB31_06800 [Bdellovibrio sp.]